MITAISNESAVRLPRLYCVIAEAVPTVVSDGFTRPTGRFWTGVRLALGDVSCIVLRLYWKWVPRLERDYFRKWDGYTLTETLLSTRAWAGAPWAKDDCFLTAYFNLNKMRRDRLRGTSRKRGNGPELKI